MEASDGLPLGDDVGGKLVLDEGQPVAERQLSLLQPLDLKLVARPNRAKGLDGGVEIAVLLPEAFEFGFEGGAFGF